MVLSTGSPARTMIMIFLGKLKLPTNSSIDLVPTIFSLLVTFHITRVYNLTFNPLPRPSTKSVTFCTVLLKTETVYPFLSILRTKFSPMTANPISPISDVIFTRNWDKCNGIFAKKIF